MRPAQRQPQRLSGMAPCPRASHASCCPAAAARRRARASSWAERLCGPPSCLGGGRPALSPRTASLSVCPGRTRMLKSRKSDLEVVSFPLCLQPSRLEGLELKRSFMILSQILLPFGHIWLIRNTLECWAAFKQDRSWESQEVRWQFYLLPFIDLVILQN